MSERIAALTFSHEIGHSFGAPHDSGECEGGGEAGHFLMHETGSLGLQPRNMELSPCSRANMTRVVSTRHCWTVDTSAQGVCGNGIVEGWEECDCGDAEQCRDKCCVALGDLRGRRPCRLVTGAQCSPSEVRENILLIIVKYKWTYGLSNIAETICSPIFRTKIISFDC